MSSSPVLSLQWTLVPPRQGRGPQESLPARVGQCWKTLERRATGRLGSRRVQAAWREACSPRRTRARGQREGAWCQEGVRPRPGSTYLHPASPLPPLQVRARLQPGPPRPPVLPAAPAPCCPLRARPLTRSCLGLPLPPVSRSTYPRSCLSTALPLDL